MQIYYFSRTNWSKETAEKLAVRYNTKANKIDDGKDWSGVINYVKGVYMSSTKKAVDITYKKIAIGEQVILVFPIWAGNFPPAVKTFVEQVGVENIIAIPTSLGSKLKTRDGFIKVIDLVGKEIYVPDEVWK